MAKNLVIVESPTKVKTIGGFLGSDYKVMSSYGHIRDLKKHSLSIDTANGFMPEYVIPDDKKELVAELKRQAKAADMVWLASDEDREGEAIAWHLYEVLGLTPEKTRRIVFHEITKPAILYAIEHPRDIDTNLVEAQQARRVLDRLVGFELSPVLWRKIKPQLSAGRVQSVAVRLLAERENEIKAFVPEEYYRLTADFVTSRGETVKAEMLQRLPSEEAARDLLGRYNGASFKVADIQEKPLTKAPAPPFTTSTLQQEAARKLGFSVSQTMRVAQSLYEAGHITYMRTDSLNLSDQAVGAIVKEIKEHMGEHYLKVRKYHATSKGAQEAHEAIRPTYIDQTTIAGTQQEQRLYTLIWKRTVASQMADAHMLKTIVEIEQEGAKPGDHAFTATGEVVKFDGFLRLYLEGNDDETAATDSDTAMLPALTNGEALTAEQITASQRFTQQPPRYTEAALVKKMEELGIGRPSTYATTITTIQQRDYVVRGEKDGTERRLNVLTLHNGRITTSHRTETVGSQRGKLVPTDVGMIVNDFLTEYFPEVIDYHFTAQIEERFDNVAAGRMKWNSEIDTFYNDFHPDVEQAMNMRLEHRVGERQLGIDPTTNRPVSVKIGRFGPMIQLGDSDGDEKPQFASLLKDQSINTITLEEALKLFDMPKSLGEYEGEMVSVAIGRFGPYVKHAGKFVSIPKGTDPYTLTLDDAIALIDQKRRDDANRVVKTFAEDPDLQILNGRFGTYIAYKKKNYKIPKAAGNAADLSLEACMKIINDTPEKPRRTTRKK